jgi:YhcH/YjgK/YiaL family protein
MITAHLKNWRAIPGLSSHPVWTAAFTWIEENAENAEEGWHELKVENVRVRVMAYVTKTRDTGIYEAHRKHIDIQYTIEGVEGVEFTPTETLIPRCEYDAENDAQFCEIPEKSEGWIENVPGRFCILYPEDAHMAQLAVQGHSEVRKLVVKVPLDAVE